MNSIDRSLWIIYNSDYYLLFFGILFFDVPRYVISAVAMIFAPQRFIRHDATSRPAITIVFSVYNGAEHILACLQSVRRQTLLPLEVIVVNDGSTDDTRKIVNHALQLGLCDYMFHHGTRCGKSASVNHAVRFAKGDLVLLLDHDTVLENDAIEVLASAFKDETVALASGDLGIHNNHESIWTSLQAIEYLISISVGRGFLDLFGAVSCCSGAFSMFRRNVYMAAGGNNAGPGEDFELTLRMRKLGYKVRFVPDAHARVEAPQSFEGLSRQRLRWDRDTLNIRFNQYKNLILFRPHELLSDSLHITDDLIFEFIPTMIFPFYLLYIFYVLEDLAPAFLFAIYSLSLGLYLVVISISIMFKRNRLSFFDLAVIPIFPFYQGVIMKLVRLIAFYREVLFRDSRHDEYVPPRVRHAIYRSEG